MKDENKKSDSQQQSNNDAENNKGSEQTNPGATIPGLEPVATSKGTIEKPEEKKTDLKKKDEIADPSQLQNDKITISLTDLQSLIDVRIKQAGVKGDVTVYANAEDRANALNVYDEFDELEVPAVYFTHLIGRFYAGDRRNGREVPHPFGQNVKFTWWTSEKTGSDQMGWNVVHIARFMTKSKKEESWMDEHSMRDIEFYKYMPDINSINSADEMFRDEAARRLKSMPSDVVVNMTKDKGNQKKYGIKILPSREEMRKNLAPVMLDMVKEEARIRSESMATKNINSGTELGFNMKMATVH